MKLTIEQQQTIEQGGAVEITVEGTKCALIQWELFEKLKRLVDYDDSRWTAQEKLALLQAFGQKAGWDDPELDVYEQYRP